MEIVPFETGMKSQPNFIHELAESYHLLNNSMIYDVAYACGSTTLSACCPNVRIPTSRGHPLSLDEMTLIFGTSGGIKSIALEKETILMEKLNIRIPSFTTVEGCYAYFADKNEKTNEYLHKQYGCIIEDEISQKMQGAKIKTHMAGSIELYSKLYDHRLDDVYLAGEKRRKPRRPYVTIIGATITNYLPKLPPHFFSQGLAGRFNWVFLNVEELKYPDDDISDTTEYNKAQNLFEQHFPKLKKLLKLCSNMDEPIELKLSEDVNPIFRNFDHPIFDEWKHHAIENPFGWDYQYKKRLSEMAIKQAGRYCIGRNIDYILKNGFDDNVFINDEDIVLGIRRVEISESHLQEIIRLRRIGIAEKEVGDVPLYTISTNQKYRPDLLLQTLVAAPNKMYNRGQWMEQTAMTNHQDFNKYRDILIDRGKVRIILNEEITDKKERIRLGADKPATKIYKAVG